MNEKQTNTTAASMPLAPIAQTIRVEVKNGREFRPEGKSETYFSADAELATPGQRWSTIRLTVKHSSPVPLGMQDIILDSFDLKKGEGVAHVVLA